MIDLDIGIFGRLILFAVAVTVLLFGFVWFILKLVVKEYVKLYLKAIQEEMQESEPKNDRQ